MRLPISLPRWSLPIRAGQLGLALVGSVAALVYLISGLISVEAAPGGLAGALADNALFRVLLVRIVTAIAFGTVGTVLLIQRPVVGGLGLIATAVVSSLTIPSAMWIPSATLYSVAGGLALIDARQSHPRVCAAWAGTPRT